MTQELRGRPGTRLPWWPGAHLEVVAEVISAAAASDRSVGTRDRVGVCLVGDVLLISGCDLRELRAGLRLVGGCYRRSAERLGRVLRQIPEDRATPFLWQWSSAVLRTEHVDELLTRLPAEIENTAVMA